MSLGDVTRHINLRYTGLAEAPCCLSCGSAVTEAQVRPGEVCIDLGSGRGQDVIRLAEAVGPTGFVYGVDVADGMVRRARRDAAKLGLSNVAFVQADLESLPLAASTAHVVISNCTINHARNKLQVWREIYRVLKPGGRFVVSDIYATEPVAEQYRTDLQAVSECWGGADTRDGYLATLAEAGFGEVRVLEESQPYAKGAIRCVSFTLLGHKPSCRCGCGQSGS